MVFEIKYIINLVKRRKYIVLNTIIHIYQHIFQLISEKMTIYGVRYSNFNL